MANTVTGIQQKFWVTAETTYDTNVAYVAGDAVDLIDLKIEPTLEFEKVIAHVGTASLQSEVEGKRGGTWSATSYVKASAAGTAPDIGPLLTAALGTQTISTSTSVTYSLSDDDDPGSLQLVRRAGDNLIEQINGAWIEQVGIEINAGAAARITFSGGFATYGVYSGNGKFNATEAVGQTVLTLSNSAMLRPNIYVEFDSPADDNSGAGYRVTAVDYTNNTITVTPALAISHQAGDNVIAFDLAQTLAGTIIGGIASGLSIDGTAIGMISGKTTIATGIKALNGEVTSNRPSRLIRGMRAITGECQVYALNENSVYRGGAWNGNTANIIQRAGANTAAARMLVNTPKARIEVKAIEIPEAEEATAVLSFVARQNSTAADELTLVWS